MHVEASFAIPEAFRVETLLFEGGGATVLASTRRHRALAKMPSVGTARPANLANKPCSKFRSCRPWLSALTTTSDESTQ